MAVWLNDSPARRPRRGGTPCRPEPRPGPHPPRRARFAPVPRRLARLPPALAVRRSVVDCGERERGPRYDRACRQWTPPHERPAGCAAVAVVEAERARGWGEARAWVGPVLPRQLPGPFRGPMRRRAADGTPPSRSCGIQWRVRARPRPRPPWPENYPRRNPSPSLSDHDLRQGNCKPGSLSRRRAYRHFSAMQLNDAINHGEADPTPSTLGRVVEIEDLGKLFRGDADTGVLDIQSDAALFGTTGD